VDKNLINIFKLLIDKTLKFWREGVIPLFLNVANSIIDIDDKVDSCSKLSMNTTNNLKVHPEP
jgi:hypothetical protein